MLNDPVYFYLTRSVQNTFNAVHRARDTHIMQVNIGWDQCMNPSDSSNRVDFVFVVLFCRFFFLGSQTR